jgi:hypothetical protein
LKLLDKAIKKGDDEAMAILATMYANGDDVEVDRERAVRLYEKAVEHGHIGAMNDLASFHIEQARAGIDTNDNYIYARKLYEKAIEGGNENAPYNLAVVCGCTLFEKGYYEHMRKIVMDTGNIRAMFEIALMLLEGHGFDKNIDEAVKIFENNAKYGDTHAMNELALLYLQGKDEKRALELLQKAIDLKDPDACCNLAKYRMETDGEKCDYPYICGLLEKSIVLGSANGAYELGCLHQQGKGTPVNYVRAVELYTMAVEHDDDRAMNSLAIMYGNGWGAKEDLVQARTLFDKAIKKNNRYAMYNMAFAYEGGIGVEKDLIKAKTLYEKAIELGEAQSVKRLAGLYEMKLIV